MEPMRSMGAETGWSPASAYTDSYRSCTVARRSSARPGLSRPRKSSQEMNALWRETSSASPLGRPWGMKAGQRRPVESARYPAPLVEARGESRCSCHTSTAISLVRKRILMSPEVTQALFALLLAVRIVIGSPRSSGTGLFRKIGRIVPRWCLEIEV